MFYTIRIRHAFGETTSRWYVMLQATQFHIPFYASRTLPNTFAMVPTVVAAGLLLHSPTASTRQRQNSQKMAILLLTFAGIVFRSELAILLAFQALTLLFTRRITISRIISAGIAGAVTGLAATLAVDSFFWQTYSGTSHLPSDFATPILTKVTRLIWPEMSAFLFNALKGNSSLWGAEPWYWYFMNAMPKLLLNPIWVVTIPVACLALPRTTIPLVLPQLGFVAVYSLLPHKEARFIFYVIPALTLVSALGASWLWIRRSKAAVYALLALSVVVSIPASGLLAAGMAGVSSLNYPGGVAVSRLHQHLPMDGRRVVVHLDVPTCMTGFTRFLEKGPMWGPPRAKESKKWGKGLRWDKTEDPATLLRPEFWRGVDWAVMEEPALAIGKFEIVDAVSGFRGVRIYRPGEEVLVKPIDTKREVQKREGLVEEAEVPGEIGLVQRARKDGFGLRELFRGWWVGVEMEEMVYILKQVRD